MPKYWVTLPVAGTISFEVKANSEAEAIEEALSNIPENESDYELTWDAYKRLSEGNVRNYWHDKAKAELTDGEDEDEA